MLATTLNLAARAKRRTRPITLANIAPTQAQAADLLALYARVLAVWAQRIPSVIAEYERSLSELQTDSASTTGGEIDSIAAEIQRLVLLLTPDLRNWALRLESVMRGKWVRSVLSATDVDLNTILTAADVEDTVAAAVNWNTSLVRDVSDELRRRIANSVFAGFQRRAPATEIAKEIREATGIARARAVRIAGDQTVKLGARLNQARQEQAGITHYVWVHSGKAHPRSWHLARNGRTYPWRGEGAVPAGDAPGQPPFCGCTGRGVITFDDD
jgi:SPP1 gp7 family putative phage head morphogenesis protein